MTTAITSKLLKTAKTKPELQAIETAIYQSWINDLDRIDDYQVYLNTVEAILSCELIEDFFTSEQIGEDGQTHSTLDNEVFEYFCCKFSKESLMNMLKQHFVLGPGGDEIVFRILETYLKLFFKHINTTTLSMNYLALFDATKEIFDPQRSYYKASFQPKAKDNSTIDAKALQEKQITIEYFNETIKGRITDPTLKLGSEVDVCIYFDAKKVGVGHLNYTLFNVTSILENITSNYFNEKKFWTRGKVSTFQEDVMLVSTGEEEKAKFFKVGGFEYTSVGFMTKDYDFRTSLVEGDLVLCHGRNKLLPATVISVEKKYENGYPSIYYKFGFRLYLQKNKMYSEEQLTALARKYWPDKIEIFDSENQIYIGDKPDLDEIIHYGSKRIIRLEYLENLDALESEPASIPLNDLLIQIFYIDSFISYNKFSDQSSPIVGRSRGYGYYFLRLLQFFYENGYVDTICNYFDKSINTNQNPDVIIMLVHILSEITLHFHKEYIQTQLAPKFVSNVISYLSSLSTDEIRTIKKESVSCLLRMLKFFQYFALPSCEGFVDIDSFALDFSIKLIQTPILDKRIAALKSIVEIIKAKKKNEATSRKEIVDIITKNNLFDEIFGINSHTQLINKSKELLEVLTAERLLTLDQLEHVWKATQKGDAVNKTTIVKILSDLSPMLIVEFKEILINKLVESATELTNEELFLLSELVKSCFAQTRNLDYAYRYVINMIERRIECQAEDKGKMLDRRVYEWVNKFPKVREHVLDYITAKLKFLIDEEETQTDRKYVAQKLRILNFLIKEQYDFSPQEIISYTELSKGSLISFINTCQTLIKSGDGKLSGTKIDKRTIKENLEMRLGFVITLIDKGIWEFSSEGQENPLAFHYNLFFNSVELQSHEFHQAFYAFCIETLKLTDSEVSLAFLLFPIEDEFINQQVNPKRQNYINLIEDEMISILNEKALATDKISELTEEAFQTYVELFFRINKRKRLLNYDRVEGEFGQYNEIFVLKNPDDLNYFSQLWNIILYSQDPNVMNKGIRILTHLFHCMKIESNWENGSELLLAKALGMIKQNLNNIHVISKCLCILKSVVINSEMAFSENNFGCISHNALTTSKKLIKLRVINHVRNLVDFDLHISLNSTMIELKRAISKKVDMHTDFLEFHFTSFLNNKFTLLLLVPESNGCTVAEMGFHTKTEIKVYSNKLEDKIPHADLVQYIFNEENKTNRVEITEQVLNILQGWFREYSTQEDGLFKMYKEDCARFMQSVTNARDTIHPDSNKVMSLFNEYDKDGLGYIGEESFVNFFRFSTINIDKRKVVWENLRNMGVRNDLKRINEPFYIHDCERNPASVQELPRLKLGNDALFFTIFDLLKSDTTKEGAINLVDEIYSFERWSTSNDFVCFVSCNSKMLDKIIRNDASFIKEGLDNTRTSVFEISYIINLIKLIVDSIASETLIKEENECKCGNPSCKSNQSVIYMSNRCPLSKEEVRQWFYNFIEIDGVSILIRLLLVRMSKFCVLNEYTQTLDLNSQNRSSAIKLGEAEKSLIQNLFRLIKNFYFTSLKTTSETYRIVNIADQSEGPLLDNKVLASRVLANFNFATIYKHLLQNLIDYIRIDLSLDPEGLVNSNSDMISELFEFLAGIISYSDSKEQSIIQQNLIDSKDFSESLAYGIFCQIPDLREKYRETISKLIQSLQLSHNKSFLNYILKEYIYHFEVRVFDPSLYCSDEFFDIMCILLSLYYSNSQLFEIDPAICEGLVDKIIDQSIIQLEGNPSCQSSHLFNYLANFVLIISAVSQQSAQLKTDLTDKYDLIHRIFNHVLFEEDKLSSISSLNHNDLVNVKEVLKLNSKKGDNIKLKTACYSLIRSLLNENVENMLKFFAYDIFTKDPSQDKTHSEDEEILPRKYMRNVDPAFMMKQNKHVGLYNLGAICYANSILQQFFMIKPFRYNLLKASDLDEVSATKDENHFHQLQRMFSFLELSVRQYYNPIYFCYSFKDWDMMPINTAIQSDCQEFISRLIDKMEESLRPTAYKYLFSSVFSGKICSSITCDTCKLTWFRFEDMYTLSLGIGGVTNIYDAIDRYTQEEKIDNFNCEKCEKRVTITKRNLLSELPNTLIIHLQRINYNYETERNIKINSRVEFPKELNLKKFCVEQVLKNKKTDDAAVTEEAGEESDEIYLKCDDYYDYNLQGVTVHLGSADSGHYFSYINTERDGKINSPSFDYADENKAKSWLEYNDKNIRKFDINSLEQECFGGKQGGNANGYNKMDNYQSAYVLFYERKLKSPIKLVVIPDQNEEALSNVIRVEENQRSHIYKSYNTARFFNQSNNELYDKVLNDLRSTIFYDVKSEEYYKYVNYYDSSEQILVKKCYFEEILRDNTSFLKQQSVSDLIFIEFYTNVILSLKSSIEKILANELVNQKLKISIACNICSFLINVLAESNSKETGEQTKKVLDALLYICGRDIDILQLIMYKIKGDFLQFKKFIFNDSPAVVENFCDFLYQLCRLMIINFGDINSSNETLKKATLKPISKHFEVLLYPLFDLLIEIFPKVPSRYVLRIGGLVKCIYLLINDVSRVFLAYVVFNRKELPFLFVTYLIGKDSPHYNATLTKKNERWDLSRPIPVNSELIINIVLKLYKEQQDELTQRDLDCVCSLAFLKFLMKKKKDDFTSLAIELNYDNEEFTKEFCMDICKQIEDIFYNDEISLVSIINLVAPVLGIRDKFQLFRFSSIIGYPQLKVDQSYNGHNFPLFGYHLLNGINSKMFEYKSNLRGRNHSSILKKFTYMANRETCIEIFLALLEACSNNVDILKYIYRMPYEEPYYSDLFEYGMMLIKTYTTKTENFSYLNRMKEIVSKIKSEMIPLLDDSDILEGFSGFFSSQIPEHVKKEEYTLLYEKDGIVVLRIDYFTTIVEYSNTLDFKDSISFIDKSNFNRSGKPL